jgi:hypothetical protein
MSCLTIIIRISTFKMISNRRQILLTAIPSTKTSKKYRTFRKNSNNQGSPLRSTSNLCWLIKSKTKRCGSLIPLVLLRLISMGQMLNSSSLSKPRKTYRSLIIFCLVFLTSKSLCKAMGLTHSPSICSSPTKTLWIRIKYSKLTGCKVAQIKA